MSLIPENALKDIVKDLSANLVPASKTNKHYPENLNPFQPALRKIRLSEYENRKLSEFLEKAILAKNIDELNKIVEEALYSGIRINARNEDDFSFFSVIVLKMHDSKFTGNKQKSIITKLALNGADFDELSNFDGLDNEKIIEICNKVKKEVEPQTQDRLKKLREVAENASMSGTVKDVEFDSRSFYMEFSKNSIVDMGKVIEGARSLGFDKGNVKLGGSIIKIGNGKVELKTGKNGERNYADVSDNSTFIITFSTSLGELHVRVYQDVKNYDQIQVKIENKELWNELQKAGEIVGQGCLFGGIPVKAVVEKGYFMRPGRSESTEVIKYAKPQSSETVSWVDKVKSDKTTFLEL
ncbi:hypothetical protein [Wolbachia endosymbiont of Folsomia candida]|uniref:hypothetical protein n=1 Tax=Wolbachia endosymbiont of Folsomia candida TaxID=169402 RepID=UPI000A944371|nr:hypothetical protein [Wolbachia endosymbiont of Folsomia candida]